MLHIQRDAYAVEAALVGHEHMAGLHESLDQLRSRALIFLGSSCDGELAGILGYAREADTVEIDRLVVDPRFFRRGAATRMVREMLVRERDARRVAVSTDVGNDPALALYASFGFATVAEDEPLPGIRVIQLERRLPGWG